MKVDALDPIANVQLKSTAQEYNGIKKGSDPESPNVRTVRPDELTTMKPGSTKSKYRELRNAAFAVLMKKKKLTTMVFVKHVELLLLTTHFAKDVVLVQ